MIQHSPAADRNVIVLGDVLAQVLPTSGLVVEIASGTGQHIVAFAERFSGVRWQPSDRDPNALASVEARRIQAAVANMEIPLVIDVVADAWPVAKADAIVCANMIHISPWEATLGLFAGAARMLGQGAPLVLYGPYLEKDVPTASSNQAFDISLRSRDSRWGIRWLHEVDAAAAAEGFSRVLRVGMPSNNLTVAYAKAPAG